MKIERVEKKCVKVRGGRSKEGRERDIRENTSKTKESRELSECRRKNKVMKLKERERSGNEGKVLTFYH